MSALDSINIVILLGALLALAGILSSLIALRFGAPLLLIFILVGMLAGESGPGGLHFDDIRLVFIVGSIALALILFDGGLRTRFVTFRSVLAPAGTLATVGVLVTSALVAPAAVYAFDLSRVEGLLMGAAVASTDAAAVFFLMHARGLRVAAAGCGHHRSGIRHQRSVRDLPDAGAGRDPAAGAEPALDIALVLVREAGARQPSSGSRAASPSSRCSTARNLPQGLHAPFVATGAIVHLRPVPVDPDASGFLAVYLAGLIVGNRAMRARGRRSSPSSMPPPGSPRSPCSCCSACSPGRRGFPDSFCRRLASPLTLMLVARPAAVFLSLWPFRFSVREKLFISWVGLRGAVGFLLAIDAARWSG